MECPRRRPRRQRWGQRAAPPYRPGDPRAAVEGGNPRGADGAVRVGPGALPATTALGILSIEFLVHAWDFAQATGQQIAVPEELSAHVLGAAHTIITPAGRASVGFDDPVEPGPDAQALDRLIAFTGRSA